MANTRMHSMRRAASILAFVTALILLTGTPARVRQIAMSKNVQSNAEYRVAAR
jgi:hypothetical protein